MRAADELCSLGRPIYGMIFSLNESLDRMIPFLKQREKLWSVRGGEKKSPYLIEFHPAGGSRLDDGLVRAFLWQEPETSIAYLLGSRPKEDFVYLAFKLHQLLRPDFFKVYLRTNEVQRALNNRVRQQEGLSFRVREYVSKSLIDDKKSLKRVRTNREWTDEDHYNVFQKLNEQKQWISSLKIEVRGSNIASGRIWRDAAFSCNQGLAFFFDSVVSALMEAVNTSRTFFENRDRQSSPTGKARPVKVVYAQDIFQDKAQNQRLIRALQGLSNSALSVFHPNPYLHASLVDYADGSSFDIWVATRSSILIVPKMKSTTESIERLCNHVCDEFEEGEVEEFA